MTDDGRRVALPGMPVADVVSRLHRMLELTSLEIESQSALIKAIKAAREKALKQGRLTTAVAEEVSAELRDRLAWRHQLHNDAVRYRNDLKKYRVKLEDEECRRVLNAVDGRVPSAVLVDRTTDLGNPFPLPVASIDERDKVLRQFRFYMMADEEYLGRALRKLHGKEYVMCHCNPRRCHGDLLLEASRLLETPRRSVPTWLEG